MIKSIVVDGMHSTRIEIPLSLPNQSGLAIRRIDGLGPVQASINTLEVATQDGSLFSSARISQRNIVLDLAFYLDPKYNTTLESIRRATYSYFPVKKEIKLMVVTDSRKGCISGYVESNEPDIFSNESGTSISIICPDPHFYNDIVKYGEFAGVNPTFKFEYENVGLSPATIFGQYETNPSGVLINDGDVDSGLEISIRVLGPATNIQLVNGDYFERMTLDTSIINTISGAPLDAGDEIYISTVLGKREVKLIRAGNSYNIINALGMNTDWLYARMGSTRLVLLADTGVSNLRIQISHRDIYLGM